jgi:CRP/FNR family transcriptional regulator
MYYLQRVSLRYFDDMRFKKSNSHVMAVAVDDDLSCPSINGKWMTAHRSWSDFVLSTYRTRFEEILEVLDNVAFRAMDERRILLKTTG